MSAREEYERKACRAWNYDRGLVPGVVYDALAKADAALAEADQTIAELQATVDGFPVKLVFQTVPVDESVEEMLMWRERAEQAEARILELEMMEPKEAHLLAVSEATIADLKRIIGHQEQALVETDEALHGAEATIEKLTWMLHSVAGELSTYGDHAQDHPEAIIDDLERRWEEHESNL